MLRLVTRETFSLEPATESRPTRICVNYEFGTELKKICYSQSYLSRELIYLQLRLSENICKS